jgi:predicted  nucleic acid-binding Zn-ribbon protein
MSDYSRILDKITDISIQIGKLETRIDSISDDLEQIKIEDSKQNQLLAEHIAGVKTNTARLNEEIEMRKFLVEQLKKDNDGKHDKLEHKIKDIEFFTTFIKSSYQVIKWGGAISASIAAITKVIGLW